MRDTLALCLDESCEHVRRIQIVLVVVKFDAATCDRPHRQRVHREAVGGGYGLAGLWKCEVAVEERDKDFWIV